MVLSQFLAAVQCRLEPWNQTKLDIAMLRIVRISDRTLEFAIDQLGRMVAFGARGADIEFRLNLPNVKLQSSVQGSDASQSRP